jgi:hypothetical protein
MGEYIKLKNGHEFKAGTCENMYYMTYKQGQEIKSMINDARSSIHASDLDSFDVFRYRFPFPDEANMQPGNFDNAFRAEMFPIPQSILNGIEHNEVLVKMSGNFHHKAEPVGVYVPCPQGINEIGLKRIFWDNNHKAGNFYVAIAQQKPVTTEEGRKELWLVCQCPYCDAAFRLPYEDVLAWKAWADSLHNPDDRLLSYLDIALAGYSYFEPFPQP